MGKLIGLRAPSTNFPVQDVYSPDLTCGQSGFTDGTVLTVAAGATVGGYWWTNSMSSPSNRSTTLSSTVY